MTAAVDADNQIAGLDPGARGRTAGGDIRHQRAARPLEPETVGDLRRHFLQPGAEPRPLDRGAAAPGRSDHDAHHVRRDRKADALRAARARIDRGVDADEPAVEVDQRAARIARIDRGVGLDEELIIADADLGARHRRDDAVRHGLADAERIADRQHQVADLQIVGIGEVQRREISRSRPSARSTARSLCSSLSTISASNSRLSDERDLHFARRPRSRGSW